MRVKLLLFTIVFSVISIQAESAQIDPYMRGGFATGLYKVHGNHRTDGDQPTRFLNGFYMAAGLNIPVGDNGFVFRCESSYIFGFYHPSTDYSAITGRVGFEYNRGDSKIIPYALIGGGIIVLDPEEAYVQDGLMMDCTTGVRVPLKNNYSVDIGMVVSRGYLKFTEKPKQSVIDRAVAVIGIQKTF